MRILITGERGYIARNLREALSDRHDCETVSLRGPKLPCMAGFDAVIHCAALVHRKKVSPAEYRAVNTELTLRLAEKAKAEKVGRFVFMSTMAVYGAKEKMGRSGTVITAATAPRPATWYGRSKLAAEEGLRALASREFAVSALRLPMVYGEGCPGNYARLAKLARAIPVFPDVDNKRSALHIENLREFMKLLLENPDPPGGFAIYCPQNREYSSAAETVRILAKSAGKKIIFSKTLGKLTQLFPFGPLRKLFGNLTYDLEMSAYFNYEYCVKIS